MAAAASLCSQPHKNVNIVHVLKRMRLPTIRDRKRSAVGKGGCVRGPGAEGAPDLTESLKNLAINGAAVAALGWLVRRDLSSSDRDKRLVLREESLARLQVLRAPPPPSPPPVHSRLGRSCPSVGFQARACSHPAVIGRMDRCHVLLAEIFRACRSLHGWSAHGFSFCPSSFSVI